VAHLHNIYIPSAVLTAWYHFTWRKHWWWFIVAGKIEA